MKKAIRCIAFLLILGIIIRKTYGVLAWKDTAEEYVSSTQQLYATNEELVDVVFLGSSHCYCAIAPDELWGNYGFSAFSMSTSGQDKESAYYLLKETLKTQSPKVVCVELWGLTFDEHAIEGNVHRNMLAMELSQNSVALIEAYVEEEDRQTDYILRWPVIHTRYKELDKYDFITNEYSEYGRGLSLSYRIGWSEPPREALECDVIGELTDSNRRWLENLYQLSLEENFELVLFMAPTDLSIENQMQVNAVKEFAKEREIPFFDFNRLTEKVGIKYKEDFLDPTHLNGFGAAKLTGYLGKYIEQEYALCDHRGEEAYYQWEKSYAYYEQGLMAYQLTTAATFEEYMETLYEMDNITYVLSLEGDYEKSTLKIEEMLEMFGVTEDTYELGGAYIGSDGEARHIMTNDSGEIYIYELNESDAFKIWNAEIYDQNTTNLDDILLNLESQGSVYDGINIVVYDNLRKTVIDKRGYF